MMILLLGAAAFLTTAFDAEMSVQEQKQTGLAKLTPQEKIALETWLNTHYMKKGLAPHYSSKKAGGKQQAPSLQDNLNNGHYIRLTDGSLWEIRPSDTPITAAWITQVEIKVGPSGDIQYPCHLTNTLTGSSVWARKTSDSSNP